MIDIQKWNFETQKYAPYTVPDNATIVLYSPDMDMTINCAGCFKEMIYGASYTSRTLHNYIGFGYPVCAVCYDNERLEEREAA